MRYPAKSFPLFFPLKGKIAELIFVPSQHQITSGFSQLTCLYAENDREIWAENMNVVFESLRAYQNKRSSFRMTFCFGFRRPKAASTLRRLKCSAEMNSASAKVLAAGQNACTAQLRRRPEGRFTSSPAAVSILENIDFSRPLHDECSYSI